MRKKNVFFSYYYTWMNNGKRNRSLWKDESTGKMCVTWFQTYPLEYCEFILDNALSNGVYLHTLSANDAFYDRTSQIDNDGRIGKDTKLEDGRPHPLDNDEEDMEPAEQICKFGISL